MEDTLSFIISRTLERLLIVLFGGASLWMGWQLFLRLQTEQVQQAELSYKDISVKLQRVGPGIFFALFGSVLLGWMTYNLPSIKKDDGKGASSEVKMMGSADRTFLEREIVALNLAYTTALKETPQEVTNWQALNKGASTIASARNRLLVLRFGAPDVVAWQQNEAEFRSGGQLLTPEIREKIRAVDNLASKLSL